MNQDVLALPHLVAVQGLLQNHSTVEAGLHLNNCLAKLLRFTS